MGFVGLRGFLLSNYPSALIKENSKYQDIK